MARIPRTEYGDRPATLGWNKMMAWLAKARNTVADLARGAGVSQPTAHAWRWRDKEPTGEHLDLVCKLTGAKKADWERVARTRRKAA